MITALEEAMNYADGIKSVVEMTRYAYEGEGIPALTGVLYLLEENMEQLCDLLAIVDAGEDMKEAPADLGESTDAPKGKPTTTKNITYEEMMSKQYLETVDLREIPVTKGTLDALDEMVESGRVQK